MRLGLLLVVALLALAKSGAVMAESEWTDEVSANAEQAPMALEAVDEVAATGDVADMEEPANELSGDEWVEASDEAVAAPDSIEPEMDEWDEMETAEVPSTMDVELVASEPVGDVDSASEITIEGEPEVVNGISLGPVGVDPDGRVGRVHTVVSGDTLWDISHAYLGTAWVWPSVWDENSKIQNPHVIAPGDRLWISSTEIRAISEDEANDYLAGSQEPIVEEVASELPADFDPEPEAMEVADDEFAAAMDDFAAEELDQLPVGMPDDAGRSDETGRTVRVPNRENLSFVSDVQLKASTSILGSSSERNRLSMLDTIYLGLGKGEVEVGEHFTIYRSITEVRSPRSNDLLGHHVDVLGWAEITEVTDDSSVAVIRVSISGAVKGDRAMPRYQPPTDIAVKYPKEDIDGAIAFLPASRTLMGTADYVFVDVGAVHGVEIGTDLEVYMPGTLEMDQARNEKRKTPDRVVADLVVVTVQEETSVAFIAGTRRELAVGDSVRGATRDFPSAF